MSRFTRHATRFVGTSLFLIALCALRLAPSAHAETIRRFDVNAELQADRMLKITETIEYDFEGAERHGIYRFIPVSYSRDGATYRLRLDVRPSTMDGVPVTQDVTSEGLNIRIRLGDPDVLITGRKTYTITYYTNRAINDFPAEGERELYWNVTGNGWEVPIEEASFTLIGPAKASKMTCFTGAFGSTEKNCTIGSGGNAVHIATKGPLQALEGLTAVVRYPADTFNEVSPWQAFLDLIRDNIWLLTPILVFFIMYGIWLRYGKEPSGRGTIIAQYEEPRGLPPALLSGVMDQEVSQKAITATLLDLARRGYMKIKVIGDPASQGWFAKKATYHFVKIKESPTGLSKFEQTLFDGLFDDAEEVSLESKKDGSFWKSIQTARHEAFEHLKNQGYFTKNPNAVRGAWTGAGIAVGVIGSWMASFVGGLFVFASIASGLIIAGFGWAMPQKTKKGAELAEEAQGFKLFLSVTEKDRLNFTDAPERHPEQFARFLPAAVAFGVEEKWGKQFADMMVSPPSYVEGAVHGWTAGQFVGMVDAMHSASASSLYHNPSSAGSGGSGFSGGGSGGGFGGGGGGSW